MFGQQWFRRWVVILLVIGIFGVYVARLINVQIVQSEEIRRNMEAGSVTTQLVKATRGEIVDRNGKSLVSNEMGCDVIIDSAFFPRDSRNEIILRLITLFEQAGEGWDDNLPMEKTAPFGFVAGAESEVEKLKDKKILDIQSYATAEDAMFRLVERYKLEDYTPLEARKIAGVRYTMERRDFGVGNPYTFASDISMELVVKIRENSYALAGVDVEEISLRRYDQGQVAPHLIGRVGPIPAEDIDDYKKKGYALSDRVGLGGVEGAFEEYLRGENGLEEIRSVKGKVVEAVETKAPSLGNTLVLTIDSELQLLAQKALENQIKYLQRTSEPGKGKEADVGAVVAIHCKTGQILVCATYPSYDLNTYNQDYAALAADAEKAPLYNRALMGLYAPGSTFKPVVGTAGMASGRIEEGSTVFCGHVYTRFHDYRPKCLGTHGNINLTRALSLSCNIFFYDVGWMTGIDNVDKYARQFGLGEPTGIELPEKIGRRSNPEVAKALDKVWNDGDVLQSSIGQLYQEYSPLQLANYAATIGNRGKRMQATLVKEIQDYSRSTVVKPFAPVIADRVDASPEVFESIIRGMVTASRSGTASAHFGSYPYDVGSKTGTPETDADPNSTFICFAPAEDPEIAIAVVIEKGWHGYTGAPVAKAVMDEYFKEEFAALGYRNPNPLVPSEGEEVSEESSATEEEQVEAVATAAAAGAPVDPLSRPETREESGSRTSASERSGQGNGSQDSGG